MSLNFGEEHKFNVPLGIRQTRERLFAFAAQYDEKRHQVAVAGRKAVQFKRDSLVMLHTPPQVEHDEEGKPSPSKGVRGNRYCAGQARGTSCKEAGARTRT